MTTDQAPTQTVTLKTEQRTIYNASSFEVFSKNFLAGFGQAVGHVLVYLVFLAIMFTLAMRFLWPTIEPYLNMYKQSMESLQLLQGGMIEEQSANPGSARNISPEELDQAQQLLQQMQQNNN